MVTGRKSNTTNLFRTTLTSAVSPSATSFPVASLAGAPSSPCWVFIRSVAGDQWEIIDMDGTYGASTFVCSSTDKRYQSGSSAASGLTHAAGSIVEVRTVAQLFDEIHELFGTDLDTELSTYGKASVAEVVGSLNATYLNKENGDTATGAVDFTGGLTDDSRRLLKTAHSGPITMLAGGAIRNDGAPDYWQPIVDVNHQCDVNVESIVTGTVAININFSAEATGKRITCYAVPDETLAALGFHVGASYSAGMMQLKLTRRFLISDYIYYDGSAWQSSQGGRFTIGTFSGGELPLTHQAMPGKSVSITPRGASSVAMLSTGTNALTDTDTKVVFRDWSGALVTTPSTDMKFFVTRHMEYGGTINPQTVDTTAFPLSNIWFAAFSEE